MVPYLNTTSGPIKIQPFSPFAPSAAYDPAVNGGAFYGDGSGDYASIAASSDFDVLSNGTFTIDFGSIESMRLVLMQTTLAYLMV